MNVEQLLAEKGRKVVTIAEHETVETAIAQMVDRQVSALIVTSAERPVGIFAERDVLRCHLDHPHQPFTGIGLAQAMTRRLIVADADEDVSAAMAMMIKADIRHLPVIKGKALIGMLTSNDLVEHQVGTLQAELHYLQDYISDLHDAERD